MLPIYLDQIRRHAKLAYHIIRSKLCLTTKLGTCSILRCVEKYESRWISYLEESRNKTWNTKHHCLPPHSYESKRDLFTASPFCPLPLNFHSDKHPTGETRGFTSADQYITMLSLKPAHKETGQKGRFTAIWRRIYPQHLVGSRLGWAGR